MPPVPLVPPPIPVPLAVPLAVPFTAPGAAPVAGISGAEPDPVEPVVPLALVVDAPVAALEVEPPVLIEPLPPVNGPSEPPSFTSDRSRPPRPPLVVLPLVGPIGDEMSPDPSCANNESAR